MALTLSFASTDRVVAADTTAPTAPTGLTATPVSASQINLSWTASTDNVGVTGYRVERCNGVLSFCQSFVQIAAPTGTSFSDTGLAENSYHVYRVRAADAAGNFSAYSDQVVAKTLDVTAPTAPTGLTATAASASQINLSWTGSTDNGGVSGYQLERCQGAGCSTFVQVAFVQAGSPTSFIDTGLAVATYRYRVRATDAAGNLSAYSNVASATTSSTADTIAPSVPTGLTATAAIANQLNLSWTASTDNIGVTGYQIERCQGAGCTTFAQIAVRADTNLVDTGLARAATYRYRVRAFDAAGNLSGYSTVVSATTLNAADTTAPSAPTGLTATPVGASQINLSWTASTDNAGVTGYRVERCNGLLSFCQSFVQIATPTGTSLSDTGLAENSYHVYRVRAVDAAGNLSAYSEQVVAKTAGAAPMQAYYIHPDHLNTPRMIANSTGTTVWRWDQGEPFGNDVPNDNPSGAGAFDFPLRFPGQYFDRETNLAYNYFRDYDPARGQYEQSDPLGLKAGLNTYLYVAANPLSFADPQGLQLLEKLLKDLTTKGTGDLTSGKATAPARGGEIGKKICTNSGGGLIRDPDRSCRADCLEKLDMSQGTGASGWLEDCVKACTDTLKQCKRPPSGCFGDGDGNRS